MDKKALLMWVASIGFYAVLVVCVALIAGTWNLPYFWAVLGIQFIVIVMCFLILDRDLLQERARPAGKDQDPTAVALLTAFYLLHFTLAALDVGRLQITDSIPQMVQVPALIIYTVGWIGMLWSMKVNRFFSSAIRIQDDRGQKVIDTGPYGIIRHPGYSFGMLIFVGEGLALGSWIGAIPAFLIIGKLVQRTLMEEKIFNEILPGYTEYTQRVRYRWIPGIW